MVKRAKPKRGRTSRLSVWLAFVLLCAACGASATGDVANRVGENEAPTSEEVAVEEQAEVEEVEELADGILRLSAEPTLPVDRPEPSAVEPSIVRVIGNGCGLPALGTGFAIEENLIVTNAHLVAGRDQETLAVQNLDGEEFAAALIGFDADLDLALLRVDEVTFAPLNLVTEVPIVDGVAIGIRTNNQTNIINEVEFTVDAPVIVNWDGVFRDTESRFRGLRMLADIRRGDSGSPLLINDQDVIGLVQSTTRNQPQGYAVGAADISEFVDGLGPIAEAEEVISNRCA